MKGERNMGANAKHALGTTLSINGNAIAELTEINGLDLSADTIDTTTLDAADGHRTFIQGLKDAGEVSLSGNFYPGDTNGQKALLTAFNNGTADTYIITFPTSMGATWTFTGIVTKYTTGAGLEDAVSFEASIKVTGKPALGVTASTGLSALSLTGTAGDTTPDVAADTHYYTHTFTTDESITITVTAANHTIKLYVNDVYMQELASGSASAEITGFDAGTSKKLTVIAYESGKTPKVYTIVAVRTI